MSVAHFEACRKNIFRLIENSNRSHSRIKTFHIENLGFLPLLRKVFMAPLGPAHLFRSLWGATYCLYYC